MKRLFLAALVLVAGVLVGCGGSSGNNGSGGSVDTTGRATFTVRWPEYSRLIPVASASIKVEVLRANAVISTQVLARPAAGGGTATATFDPLPVGDLTARATAYPQADGTDTAQATASVPLPIRPGETTTFNLTMASTIDRLEVSPTGSTMAVGQSMSLAATAKDAAGNIVLISSTSLAWLSSNQSVATVDGNGKVTAVGSGTAQITVTETESAKSAVVTITVTAGSVKCNPASGHCYELVPSRNTNYAQAQAAAEARTLGPLKGHLLTLSSQAETDFLVANFSIGGYMVGAYQDRSSPTYSEPGGGWRWTTQEPFTYTNWFPGEPTNTGGGEDITSFHANGKWNDFYDGDFAGYIVEYE